MPTQLTLYVDAAQPLAPLIVATVTEACAAVDPSISLQIIDSPDARSSILDPLVTPALRVAGDPTRHAIGRFTMIEEAARAITTLLDQATMIAGDPPDDISGPPISRPYDDEAAILALDDDGVITAASARAAELLGVTPAEAEGLPFGIPVGGEERALALHRPDGTRRVIALNVVRGVPGTDAASVVFLHDRTTHAILRSSLEAAGLVDRPTGLLTLTALRSAWEQRCDDGARPAVVAIEVRPETDGPFDGDRLMVSLIDELDDAAADSTLLGIAEPRLIAAIITDAEDPASIAAAAMRCLDSHRATIAVGTATEGPSFDAVLALAVAHANGSSESEAAPTRR